MIELSDLISEQLASDASVREYVVHVNLHDDAHLLPSATGGMRWRSVLDKTFRDVLDALGWSIKLTPRGMRWTFNNLAP